MAISKTAQKTIKEAMLILASEASKTQIQMEIYEKVFLGDLNSILQRFQAVFRSREYIVECIVGGFESTIADEMDLITDFLVFFTVCASKIEGVNWTESIWDGEIAISARDLMENYPLAKLWKPLLDGLIPVIHLLQGLSDQGMFSTLMAHKPDARNNLYGLSVVDCKKYLSSKPGSSSAGFVRYPFKEAARTFLSASYKLLAVACKRRVVYFLFSSEFFAKQLFSNIPFLENYHLIIFVRYFLPSFVLNSVKSHAQSMVSTLTVFLEAYSLRLSNAWSDHKVPMTSTMTAESFLSLLHRDDLASDSFLSSGNGDDITTVKVNIRNDLTRALSETLATLTGFRGPLATANVAGLKDGTDADRLAKKCDFVSKLLFPKFRRLNGYLCQTVLRISSSLLCLPDPASFKEILAVNTLLIYISLGDQTMVPTIAADSFRTVLYALLRAVS